MILPLSFTQKPLPNNERLPPPVDWHGVDINLVARAADKVRSYKENATGSSRPPHPVNKLPRQTPSWTTLLKLLALQALLVGSPWCGRAEDAPTLSRRICLDADWRFQRGDPADAGDTLSYPKIKDAVIASSADFAGESPLPPASGISKAVAFVAPQFDDSTWRKLDLPHDWGIEGAFEQDLPSATGKLTWSGVGWYRKRFKSPVITGSPLNERRLYLDIDGAMAYAVVWCNGRFVGGWPYGYASFRLDLTPYLQAGGENVLAIRLDNPPNSSRWYPGGGIYRHVWLLETASVHLAHWGNTVTTPKNDAETAAVHVRTGLENHGARRDATVKTEIFACGPDGHAAGSAVAIVPPRSLTLESASVQTVESDVNVPAPKLWDTEHPNLYAAVTTVLTDNQPVDQEETVFGIRTFQFTADNGFLLNGRRVPIRGVCGHHDLGALGTAFNLQALERQFATLKEMGCNAFRTSHNPPAPELLDLCDRLGILVMDEAFDCWKTGKTDNDYHLLFDDWCEKDLRALVRRDRNHPSVILWSIGNEVPDQMTAAGPILAAKLTRVVHEEDDTRLTTTACDKIPSGYNDFHKGVDVFGYNYKPEQYQKFHEANPTQPLIGSETSSGYNSRGSYFFPVTEDRRGGLKDFQVSSFDLYYDYWATGTEREFRGEDAFPFVAGEFVWTGFDYLGEPTPYDANFKEALQFTDPRRQAQADAQRKKTGEVALPSRSSYFGIMDLAGFPKDRYYLYQSRWRPELPMAHLLPHWTWPEREGATTPVHVYTSGDEAELFLNGRSLGRKRKGPGEYRLRWDDVKYAPGELKVTAYKNGELWATDTMKTAGPAVKLVLAAEPTLPSGNGVAKLIYVSATVIDAQGLFVPRADNLLHFSVSGPAELIATDNGDATDHGTFREADRHAFNGKCLAILRVKPGTPGTIMLNARSAGLESAECACVNP